MTATDFLDHYGESLHHSSLGGPISARPRLRERVRDFRRVRDELHAQGVSDNDIAGKLKEIMGYIMAHLGDIAKILALVLPLFLAPNPAPPLAVESDE